MALVAKESILVIILRGQILEFCGTLRLGGSDVGLCWPSADLVGRVIVADAEIHGQLSAVPRYFPSRKDLLTSRFEAAICYPQAVPKCGLQRVASYPLEFWPASRNLLGDMLESFVAGRTVIQPTATMAVGRPGDLSVIRSLHQLLAIFEISVIKS